ncbi:246_t:CDS:2, partial [Acaulospora morrowiae]
VLLMDSPERSLQRNGDDSPKIYATSSYHQSVESLGPTASESTVTDQTPRLSRVDFRSTEEDSEISEEVPLLGQRYASPERVDALERQYAAIQSKTNPRQEYVVNVSNNKDHTDLNFETNSYDETDSENGATAMTSSRRKSRVNTDVCFPMIEAASKKGIDYEALEDHIRTENEKRKREQRRRQRRLSEPASAFTRKSSGTSYNAYEGLDKKHPSESTYRYTFYSTAYSTVHARSLSEVPPAGLTLSDMMKAGCWWIDVLSPTDTEMRDFGRIFGIHPLTVEDIEIEETREKCELFKEYYFICFRSFDQDHYSPTYLQPVSLYMVVMKEGIISFHFRPTPHPSNVRRRIKQLKDYITVTPDWINYAIIDDITDSFAPLIRTIEFEVDSIDELVLILKESEQTDMLRRIGHCRKKVLGLLRLLGNKADVMKGLIKRCSDLKWDVVISNEIVLYMGDIQDHIITMVQNLNHYEMILSRSHSNYLAQISIEMTQANNQINDILSRLTALGTILIPMNLVTGLWGMNVQVPGQEAGGLTWFISILAGLLIFAIIGVVMAHRTGIV